MRKLPLPVALMHYPVQPDQKSLPRNLRTKTSRFGHSWRRCRDFLQPLLTVVVLRGFAADVGAPLPADDELNSFHFADAQLMAELMAAEPLVSSPVALTWDADGRLFVAEMRDYPNSTSGGAIRQLEDSDGDGRYERSTVFADRLPFPNSVLPWNGGILVTAAPDLWFLRDTSGDGVADERRVLFTGFGTGNQQLRANGLFWGLDGWVYAANGRSDGEVRWLGQPIKTNLSSAAAKGVSIRGRDFRFRPDTGEFETLAGRSQFGHTRDDWGNRFLSWNTIPARHEVFPDYFLARNPALTVGDVLQDCLPAGDVGRVFPLTPPPLVFNNESGEHFNALSGLHVFRGDALGNEYSGQAWVGESLRNLAHRRVLVPDGPTFRAERADGGCEFLASTDPWFHPVNFATGPDGALYVVDFYRKFVEHPDWVAAEMRGRVAWAEGNEYGRIWRILRKDRPANSALLCPALTALATPKLVEELGSANGWRRDTAQRLLLERKDPSARTPLQQMAQAASRPESRVQALYTLEVLAQLDAATLLAGLADPHPRVLAASAQIAGRWLVRNSQSEKDQDSRAQDRVSLIRQLTALASHADDGVRLQVALALGSIREPQIRETALESIAAHTTNRWLLLAIASSSQNTNAVVRVATRSANAAPGSIAAARNADPDRERVIERFRGALQMSGDRERGAIICAQRCLTCHYLQGHGQRVGPDLSGLAARPAETLLIDLLDPNRQVAPDYVSFEIVTKDGRSLTGLLAAQTETRLTLRYANAPDESFAREQLAEVRPTGRSLMPDGLESDLTEAALADLLAFLRAPDGELLPK